MKQLTDAELSELIHDTAPRLDVVVRILRDIRAQLDDDATDAFKLSRVRGSLDAITDELANAATPLVLAAGVTRGRSCG